MILSSFCHSILLLYINFNVKITFMILEILIYHNELDLIFKLLKISIWIQN